MSDSVFTLSLYGYGTFPPCRSVAACKRQYTQLSTYLRGSHHAVIQHKHTRTDGGCDSFYIVCSRDPDDKKWQLNANLPT